MHLSPCKPYPPSSSLAPFPGVTLAKIAIDNPELPSRILFILLGNFVALYFAMGIALELTKIGGEGEGSPEG